jgi:hypothetical protein
MSYGLKIKLKIFVFPVVKSHVRWVPVPTAWRVLGLRMGERPPAMEGTWEYIGYAADDKQQAVVLQLGGWASS